MGPGDRATFFVDAHIHLSDPDYSSMVESLIAESRSNGVVAMAASSVDFETSLLSIDLGEKYTGLVYPTVGIHPWNVKEVTESEVEATERLMSGRVVGVGEVGMDGSYGSDFGRQEAIFRRMLALAEKTALPVVVHSRDAVQRILEITASYRLRSVLFHWYSGPTEFLKVIADRGYYVSEGPPVAYSARIQEVVRSFPASSVLTETDGPVVYRGLPKGTRTTPSLIPSVVGKMAEIKGMEVEDLAELMLENFRRLFSVSLPVPRKR